MPHVCSLVQHRKQKSEKAVKKVPSKQTSGRLQNFIGKALRTAIWAACKETVMLRLVHFWPVPATPTITMSFQPGPVCFALLSYLVSCPNEYLNHGRQHKAATGAKLLINVGVHICQLCLVQLGSALADVSCGGGGNGNLVFPFVQSDLHLLLSC